ncbi:dehydrogenase/reductase SDR family member 7-like [Hylaeus volcanicus]|uniref:dehydrogenase/reductase SDR family member 7-like n=1 Tax=Hylaeus volcanicus TaxID=313075 RepID=UPI0023B7B55B|nr:dehydrogenase/reductase SDR family member 7-like [Hylaeus volcanicus]
MDLLSIILLVILLIIVAYHLFYLICPWFLNCDINLAFHNLFGKRIRSLKGKVVWITGASSGIGENLAYILADVGCKLVLSARRKEELDRVKASCLQRNKKLNDLDVEVLPMDVCDINSHEAAFNRVIEKFNRLDILVNNAGRYQLGRWEQIDISVDKGMFELNVFAQVALTRVVVKYFTQMGTGHIVVTSSLGGVVAMPFSGSYSGSKFALQGYFYSFWYEKLGQNIPVTIVCPGAVHTNFLMASYTEKSGETYGDKEKDKSPNRLNAERCAKLIGVAIANKLFEVWIAKPLVLQMLYMKIYYPNLTLWSVKMLGPRFLQYIQGYAGVPAREP